MRMLLAAATLVALGSLATAQTLPPAPPATASPQDEVRKAWIGHAIEHILGGTRDAADRIDARPAVLN